jgi:hypothetical protein
MDERPTRNEVCTSSTLHSLQPCLGQDASWRARVGRVSSLASLSLLQEYFPVVPYMRTIEVLLCRNGFSAAC